MRAAALFFLVALAASAFADLRVVSQLRVVGAKGEEPRTVTTYYQGDMIRLERPDSTSIINTKTRQTLLLDDKTKTYFEFSPARLLDVPLELAKLVKVRANAFTKAMPEQKTIADRPAVRSILDVNVTLSMASMPGFRQRMRVRLDAWTTAQLPLDTPSIGLTALLHGVLGGLESVEGVQPALLNLATVKGLPLSYKATLTTTFSVPPAPGKPASEHSMEVELESEVESLSEDPLDPALFQVPPDYTNTAPPTESGPTR